MMKRCARILLVAVLLGPAFHSSCRSLAIEASRGPVGPGIALDCGGEEEATAAGGVRSWLTVEDCRQRYVSRLRAALATVPGIDSFGIRSGETAAAEIPPSEEWTVGASPQWPEARAWVIPVRFDAPLRWRPYIVTWFAELETVGLDADRNRLVIAKESPTPEGFEIHLVATGDLRVPAARVGWVAYDTTTETP